MHAFDEFFEREEYDDGQEPEAFADWLVSQTGNVVIGRQMDGDGLVVAIPEDD